MTAPIGGGRDRGVLCVAALVLATAAALLPAVADARPTLRCKSADLRYPFQPGGPKTFGVFKLRITGSACRTARRVAKAWMKTFESNIRHSGHLVVPRRAAGFVFDSLPPDAAQTFNERGRKHHTTIRFDYVVPNG